MSAKRMFLLLAAALMASAWSCSSDVSSGFETGPDDADATPILNDVTPQPFDAKNE